MLGRISTELLRQSCHASSTSRDKGLVEFALPRLNKAAPVAKSVSSVMQNVVGQN